MAEIYRVFIRALQRLWGPDYWVAWPPGSILTIGDVGRVADGRFTTTGTLAGRGIDVGTADAGGLPELVYDSDGAVSVTLKVAGESAEGFRALSVTEAGAQVRFSRENAVLAVYTDLRETRVAALRELAEQLTQRFWEGTWSAGDAVVTHVVRAGSTTALVGLGRESQAELRATTEVASLAALAADVGFAHRDRLGLAFTGQDVTPFFRLLRLRRTFTGRLLEDYGRGLLQTPGRMPAGVIEQTLANPEGVLEVVDQLTTIDGAAS